MVNCISGGYLGCFGGCPLWHFEFFKMLRHIMHVRPRAFRCGLAGVIVLLVVGAATSVAAQTLQSSLTPRTARRDALLLARAAGARVPRPTTSVVGAVWSATDQPVVQARVRLRVVTSGLVAAEALTSDAGEFAFERLTAGTYMVEVASDGGDVIAVGQPITVTAGETVATFLRLPPPPTWYLTAAALLGATSNGGNAATRGVTIFLPDTAVSVISTAATAGVTGFGEGRKVSAEQ